MANNRYLDLSPISHAYLENSLRVPMWVDDGSYEIETGLNKWRIYTEETLPDEVKALLSMIHSFPEHRAWAWNVGGTSMAYIAPDERLAEIGWKVTDNLYMLVLERNVVNRLNGA